MALRRDTGTALGSVADGSTGINAILTARGDGIVRDSTGVAVRQPLGTAGKFLGSDGTDQLYRYAPGALIADDDGTSYSNTTAQTSVLSAGAITGGFLAGIAKGDAHNVIAAGTWKNQTSANQTLTFDLFFGSGSIATFTSPAEATSANTRAWYVNLWVVYRTIAGAGSGAVKIHGTVYTASGPDALSIDSPAAIGAVLFTSAASVTPAAATNAAAAFDLKTTLSTSTSTGTVQCNLAQVRYYPKNY